MRHQQDRLAAATELGELVEALVGEALVAHREDLVDEEHIGIDVHGDGEDLRQIVTMDGDTPTTVEAVVTHGDRIAFAGTEKAARKAAGKDAAIHDLHGATMLPGFIDAHSHFTVATMSAGGLDLRNKAHAGVTDIPKLQAAIRDYIAARAIPPHPT